jgi:hypothetical protein
MNRSSDSEREYSLLNRPFNLNGDIRTDIEELMGCSYDSFMAQVETIRIDNEREKLMFIFGEKAKIEKREDGEWLVELVLESRGIVPGGQKIDVRLGEETSLEIKKTGYVFNNLYPLKEVKIDGGKIELSPKIFFSPTKTGQNFLRLLNEAQMERTITDFEYKIFGNGTRDVTVANRYIIMGDFQSAEDLIALLHEIGHTKSKNPHQVGVKDHKSILESVSKLLPGECLSKKENKTLLEVLKEEKRANNQALSLVKKFRKNGIDLFPKDPSLTQVKLFLSMCLSTFLKGLEGYIDLEL